MANVMLISVNDVNAEGIRSLSANLKRCGHKAHLLFLKRYDTGKEHFAIRKKIEKYDWVGINKKGKAFRYCRGPEVTDTEKKLLLSLIKEIKPDLIGFSVNTPLKKRITEISKLIKSVYNIPLVWGGAAPTIDAESCLNDCDIVCVGEGEKSITDIATRIDNKKDIREVKNLVYLNNEKIIRNPLHPLTTNLDELPFKDIYPDNKFLIENNSLVRNFKEVSYSQNLAYHITSSRGCPYNCSYCCENFFKKLYSPENFLRRRSPENVIKELKEAREVTPYEKVIFEDEIFSQDCNWLSEFRDIYKKEIDSPFICYIYPNKNINEQLKLLKETGLISTCLAIQAGSERINREVFKRPFNKNLFLETAHILASMGISYYTDIITYNPFEEEKDLQATLNMLNRLPKPFGLCVNKLYVLKGTEIYNLVNDLRSNKERKALPERIFNYYSRLFWISTQNRNGSISSSIQKIAIFKYFPFLINWFLFLARLMRKKEK